MSSFWQKANISDVTMMSRRQTFALGGIALISLRAFPHPSRSASYYPEDYGAIGDGLSDDADAINACDLAACAGGGTVVFRKIYRVASQLLMSANWQFIDGEIVRDWTGKHHAGQKDVSATIKGRGNDPYSAFFVDPGPYYPKSVLRGLSMTGRGRIRMSSSARAYYDTYDTFRATMLYMLCNDFRLDGDIRFALGGRDWCICFGGDGFRGGGFRIYSETGRAALHEDGFHVLYGQNGQIDSPDIESGDDSIAFANNLNLGISDWLVITPKVFSYCAFGIKLASKRYGATEGYGSITEAVERIQVTDVHWAAPNGRPSRNGYVRFDAGDTNPGIIRNCRVTGGEFAGENNGLPPGISSGVTAISFAGPVEDCFIQALVRHPSLWTVRMVPATNGRSPTRSGINIECPDPPNWARGKDVGAIDMRGAQNSWIEGAIRS